MKKTLLAFILGTFVSFVSMLYIFKADYNKNKLPMLHAVPFFIAGTYGIANVINIHLMPKQKYTMLLGAVMGILYSFVGRFLMGNLPVKLFGFTDENAYLVHPLAAGFYALIFELILKPLNMIYL